MTSILDCDTTTRVFLVSLTVLLCAFLEYVFRIQTELADMKQTMSELALVTEDMFEELNGKINIQTRMNIDLNDAIKQAKTAMACVCEELDESQQRFQTLQTQLNSDLLDLTQHNNK